MSTGINVKQIQELASQLRDVPDCQMLAIILPNYMEAINKLSDSIKDVTKEQLDKILPLLKIPGPNPAKIVGWIKKNVVGSALPQLKAYVGYLKELIQLAQALEDLMSAVKDIDDKIKRCALSIENPVVLLKNQVDSTINNTLSTIDNVQSQITTIINIPNTIQTTSVNDFVNSVNGGMAAVEQAGQNLLNTPSMANIGQPLISGLSSVGQTLTVGQGEWNTEPSSYSFQWYRVNAGVKSELFGATEQTYVPTANDVGSTLFAVVTAINTLDSEEVQSNTVVVT